MGVKIAASIPNSGSEDLKSVLRLIATKWGDVVEDLDSIQMTPLNGAMTNEIFMINWPEKNGENANRKVLVRVYGEGVDRFFDRKDEIETFECVSRHGQGPKLLGRFDGGRVEEFIHARTLCASDLRDPAVSALVAWKMREFHNLDIPGPKTVFLWQRLGKWLEEAKGLCSQADWEEFRLAEIGEEIEFLEKELSDENQEIGFCHNDLQYGNIMIDEDTNAVTLIDYEYASYNPVAYDIANHFCEMAANYHSKTPHVLDYGLYPGLEERKRFVRTYLSSSGNKPKDEEVEQLLKDAERYTLPNHLFWGLWGLISGYVNNIDFDYKEYARQRFEQYWLRKRKLINPSRHSYFFAMMQ